MNADRVIFGENCIYSTDCQETQLNNNVVVCGSSGCGKTMSISEPCLLETEHSSLIVTLSKQKLPKKYTPLFRKRGYRVLTLDFAQPKNSTAAYDPLAYIASYRDITFLAEALVKSDPKKTNANMDPFWDEAAVSLLSAEIAYIIAEREHPTFADVLDLHNSLEIEEVSSGIRTTLDSHFAALAQKQPKCFAVTCWKSFRQLPMRTAGCVYGTLNTTLDTLFTPELHRMIRKHESVDFARLGSEQTVLFVVTSAVNPALNRLIQVFYAQTFKQLFEAAERCGGGALPVPVRVLCDDFAVGGTIHQFHEYISIFREKGISVTLLLQSESQLESMYGPNNATTILNNCDTYLYMGGMDLKTCRSVSERLDVPLDEVLSMPLGRVVVFRRGQPPIVTRRYDILRDKRYQQVTAQYEKGER